MSQLQLINKKGKDWKILEFFAPISERIENDMGEFLISGVAINETTTLNNVKYVSEELSKATESFRDVPILLDHKNEVKNIVGRTTENVVFNSALGRIEYEAKIMDNDIKEMIKDGRIKNVSIGAKVEDLIEESDGSMKAVGIHGLEISIVAVPGDGQASLGQAIKDNFHLKESLKMNLGNTSQEQLNKEQNKMTEVDKKLLEDAKLKEEAEVKAKEEKKVTEEKAKKLVELNTQIAESEFKLKEIELANMKKKIAEADEPSEPEDKKKVEDKTKGEVSTETGEKLKSNGNMVLEKAKLGYSMYRDYSAEGADTKLKRLVR